VRPRETPDSAYEHRLGARERGSRVTIKTELKVTERGSGETLVVFVHGVLDRGRSFDQVVERLESDCRMLTYDRRGYGDSRDVQEAAVGVPEHVDDLLAILAGRPAVVVGHSFGGNIVLNAAVRAPEIVPAVALYETVVPWAAGWDDKVMLGVLTSEHPEQDALRLMLGDRYEAMDPEAKARRHLQAQAFLEEERSMRFGPPLFDVSAIRTPLVYGKSDEPTLMAMAHYLQREIPGTQVVTLPNGDHHAHRTDPDGFADLVRQAIGLAR
jgi:pimeloyl-ACP methyl ester carboxylesterase